VLPEKSNVKAVLERETLLHSQSWKNIKDCVRNLITKRHHPTTFACPNFGEKKSTVILWILP